MATPTLTVRITETGKELQVVLLSRQANRIEVVLGEGAHSMRCELTPNRAASAYVGSAMGREIVYERSRKQVQEDIDRSGGPRREFQRR